MIGIQEDEIFNMIRSKHQRSPEKHGKDRHWASSIQETIVSSGPQDLLNFSVKGGAEYGLFCYIGDLKHDKVIYHSGKFSQDDVIIEIQGQKVAGFTLWDLYDYMKYVGKNGAPVIFETVKSGRFADASVIDR